MYFTNGSSRAFEMLMRGKPGFDRYENGGCADCEDCNTCHFYRPHWKYQFCVYAECPYEPGLLTALRAARRSERKELITYGSLSGGAQQEALSGVTSFKYLNNAKTPSREITRWRFLTKHVSYVNT